MDFRSLSNGPGGWAAVAAVIFLILMTNACHEGGHAFVAWCAGDRRASIRRRCTLNPLVHLHWFLTIVLPLLTLWLAGFLIGGARPVMVDRSRTGRFGMALTALAGPAGNLLCAGFLGLVLALAVNLEWWGLNDIDRVHSPAWMIFLMSIWFSLFLMFLNLIPLPGLDGGHVVGMMLPSRVQTIWYLLTPATLIILLGTMFYFSGLLHDWGLLEGERPTPWPFQKLYHHTGRYVERLIDWVGTKL